MFKFGFVGVDETADVAELVALSRQHDWIEWGLCLCYQGTPDAQTPRFAQASGAEIDDDAEAWWDGLGDRRFEDGEGRPRMYGYPGWDQIRQVLAHGNQLKICLHLNEDSRKPKCHYVSAILNGEQSPDATLDKEESAANLVACMKKLPSVQFILPFRHTVGPIIERVLSSANEQAVRNIQLFHDPSGGSGTSASSYQDPSEVENFGPRQWIGFTGGVRQENVVETLVGMRRAAKGRPFWSDMQTNVREPTTRA